MKTRKQIFHYGKVRNQNKRTWKQKDSNRTNMHKKAYVVHVKYDSFDTYLRDNVRDNGMLWTRSSSVMSNEHMNCYVKGF